MKEKLFKIANILLIIGLILAVIIVNFMKDWEIRDYSSIYEQEIRNLQQHIPAYKIYETAKENCDTGVIYDLNDVNGNKKIQNSCVAMQKTACELYPGQAKCISAKIKNSQNKSVLKDYKGAFTLLKSVEKPSLEYFNARSYYDPDPYMLNFETYAAYSQVYFGMGDYKKAEDYTEKAAAWGSKEFKAHSGLSNYAYYQLAENYFKAKNYKKALNFYNKIQVTYSFREFIKHPGYALKDIFKGPVCAKKQIEICKKKLNEN